MSAEFMEKYGHIYELAVLGKHSDNTTILRRDRVKRTLVITPLEVKQPWQVAEVKRQMKASAVNMAWNERREAREARKALETQFASP